MKKFILCTLTLSSVLLVSAGTLKSIKVAKTLNTDNPLEMQQTASLSTNYASTTHKFTPAAIDIQLTNQEDIYAVNHANDITAGSNTTANYIYPTGTLFPIWWFTSTTSTTKEAIEYYQLYHWLLPAATEITFPNFSYTTTDGTAITNGTCSWKCPSGIYSPSYTAVYRKSTDFNLTEAITPHWLTNYQLSAPTLTIDGNSFTLGTTVYGGNGAFNPGVEAYYKNVYSITSGNVRSQIVNYNNAANQEYPEIVAGYGSYTGLWNSDKSINELRDFYLSSQLSENGIDARTFHGIAQTFNTGENGGILSEIALPAYVKATVGDEVNITLYQVIATGEGDNATESWNEITSGAYKFTEKVDTFAIVSIDIFDENTEKKYIALEPNSSYVVMFSGFTEGISEFVPWSPTFAYSTSDYSVRNDADNQNHLATYSVYLNNGKFVPISAYNYWNLGTTTAPKYYMQHGIALELGIKYPFLIPVASYLSADGYYMMITDATINNIDLNIYELGEGYSPMGVAIVFSDASSEELLSNIEYSSDALKDIISVSVTDGEGSTNTSTGITFTSNVREIRVTINKDIPADAWIKFRNYNETLTINIPKYQTTGIETIANENKVISTQLFDLQGRKLVDSVNGIAIKQMKMADGSVKAVKVAL